MDGHSPAPSIITRSTTRTTSTSRTGTTISTNGHDDHDHLDLDYEQELEELTTLNSSIVMMDSESDSEYRSIIDVPWSASEASTFNTSITDEKVTYRDLIDKKLKCVTPFDYLLICPKYQI